MSDVEQITKVSGILGKYWFKNNLLHRDNGPAIEMHTGDRHWYRHGKLHREDGPAVELSNGIKHWYIDGEHPNGIGFQFPDESVVWFHDGCIAPSRRGSAGFQEHFLYEFLGENVVVRTFSTDLVEWRLDGKLHREDGPAVEFANGEKYWYRHGKLHREDGPAFESADGDKYWFINGEELTEDDFNARNTSCAEKIIKIEGKKYKLVPMEE